jgi:hypothetical protein
VTLYLVKHGLSADRVPANVRPAADEDVSAIVTLSAQHRKALVGLSARFWHIHPEADRRFDSWMRRSLTFKDRDMLVTDAANGVHGYVIAQPCSPLLVPLAHEVAGLGIIDDFYDKDFANVSAVADGGSNGEALLMAAESAFARRGVQSTLVVCPAAWSSKISVLQRRGYRTAKLWMLKRQEV